MADFQNPSRGSPDLFRSFILRYGCAVISIGLATWIRALLDPALGDLSPFPTLLFAVLLTAWYGGVWPALVAVILGVFLADYFLIPPRGSFGFKGAAQYIDLAVYLGVGGGISVLGGMMHGATVAAVRKLQQTRDALATTEERSLLTLRASGIAVWSWQIAPNIIEADENSSVLFGLPVGQFPRKVEEFAEFEHPDDRERVQQEIAAAVEHGAEYSTEFRIVWPNGTIHSVTARGKVYCDPAGRPQRMTGVTWDVTERRQTEEKL